MMEIVLISALIIITLLAVGTGPSTAKRNKLRRRRLQICRKKRKLRRKKQQSK
jgi:hypothetical protein